jgi:hypothetical protein
MQTSLVSLAWRQFIIKHYFIYFMSLVSLNFFIYIKDIQMFLSSSHLPVHDVRK